MADIDKVLQLVNLEQRKFSKFSTYSLGMKQRLAIASSLLGDPDVLVFDEPTNGLDPVGIVEIRELIKKLSKEGKTIIMASHLLDEVEKVCTHVAILQKGTLLTHGHVDEILVTEDIVETSAADMQQLQTILQQYPGAKTGTTERTSCRRFVYGRHSPPGSIEPLLLRQRHYPSPSAAQEKEP